ncbi:3-isopropylmalate dehydratase small subunit [Phormidium yuhuli AB48]|uniref:3-isopropylmalate dehydratase small subunit n=1 Tax=Phormidium yuhuli AB48 TaxID=2940671 RepID=A0ABY5ATI8_9CYAN|nr:3-isopropylmalate dehydratase small subunit [Phormidium yuhuli]USR92503.1 3-isopropylmalate dehydratase small subunit [Phormidium yuhuli AB48]
MTQVKQISGRGIPLTGDDIDTDRIIPARFLRCVTFDGLGDHAFEDDRRQMTGQHPFDQAVYQGASLLVVNANFGCGSSREHAPQAINRWGIQALVGESFAEIFFGNCVAMGVPCVTASSEDVKSLQTAIANNPQLTLTLDLDAMEVRGSDGLTLKVSMPEGARQSFRDGLWDSCGQLATQINAVRDRARELPYLSWT